jgi:hypothetical protein
VRFRITTLWAFVAIDQADDEEGICAQLIGDTWMPMIGADEKRLEQLRPVAEKMAKIAGTRIQLIRFIRGAVVQDFKGELPA